MYPTGYFNLLKFFLLNPRNHESSGLSFRERLFAIWFRGDMHLDAYSSIKELYREHKRNLDLSEEEFKDLFTDPNGRPDPLLPLETQKYILRMLRDEFENKVKSYPNQYMISNSSFRQHISIDWTMRQLKKNFPGVPDINLLEVQKLFKQNYRICAADPHAVKILAEIAQNLQMYAIMPYIPPKNATKLEKEEYAVQRRSYYIEPREDALSKVTVFYNVSLEALEFNTLKNWEKSQNQARKDYREYMKELSLKAAS